jgi:presequence protease
MEIFSGFTLVRERSLPEFNSEARFYRHAKTGAELLSLVNDDDNKVFGVTFRTPPRDSTGVAHILEHAVLCGSRKYPVKEPFVELMKGSLNTFLNAMTFPDKTCYPVASQNLRDFYNLIDVYLDAVFYPLITPNTFQQEGWHYELDAIDELHPAFHFLRLMLVFRFFLEAKRVAIISGVRPAISRNIAAALPRCMNA